MTLVTLVAASILAAAPSALASHTSPSEDHWEDPPVLVPAATIPAEWIPALEAAAAEWAAETLFDPVVASQLSEPTPAWRQDTHIVDYGSIYPEWSISCPPTPDPLILACARTTRDAVDPSGVTGFQLHDHLLDGDIVVNAAFTTGMQLDCPVYNSAVPVGRRKYDVETLFLHELGHLVRIKHAEADPHAVMTNGYRGCRQELTVHDIADANTQYGHAH